MRYAIHVVISVTFLCSEEHKLMIVLFHFLNLKCPSIALRGRISVEILSPRWKPASAPSRAFRVHIGQAPTSPAQWPWDKVGRERATARVTTCSSCQTHITEGEAEGNHQGGKISDQKPRMTLWNRGSLLWQPWAGVAVSGYKCTLRSLMSAITIKINTR